MINVPATVFATSRVAYAENAAAVALSPSLAIFDDNVNLYGARITISGGFQPGQDVLSFTSQFGITGSFNAGTGVLTLSGTASLAQYQSVLRSVKYFNSSDAPVTGDRTVRFEVNDGGLPSPLNLLSSTATVNVTASNDRPVIAGLDTMTYTGSAQGLKQVIDADLTVTDPDSSILNGATVRITGHYVPGQDVLGFVAQNGIVGSFNAATGTLSLFGSASAAAYQAAFRSITYQNTQPAGVDASDRIVSFQVRDSAGAASFAATATITYDAAPVVKTTAGTAAYTEGGAATVVDSALTVKDVDSPTLTGATVSISAGFEAGDVLAFANTANITGVYNGATGVLTLTGVDTLAAYQAALRSITFGSTNEDPAAARTVTWTVFDGQYTSAPATRDIAINSVNDAPVITSNGGDVSAYVSLAENTTAVTTVTATDVDGDNLTYSITGGANSSLFTIDAATGALSFITAPDYENPQACGNSYDVIVAVSDGTLSDTQDLHVSVYNVNEAPVITSNGGGASASVSVTEGGTTVTTLAATDADGNTIGYSIAGGADSALFTINGSTGALSFITAPDYENPLDAGNDNGYDVTVQASDGTLTDTQAIVVTVYNGNDAPVITSNGGGASAYVSRAENTTSVTTVTATDVDGNNLTYAITGGVHSSLFTIDSATGALSFITAPDYENPQACGNSYDVSVTVSDGPLSDTQDIHVSLYNVNEAPSITSNGGDAGAAVSVTEGGIAVTTVSATDQDGNSIGYSITGGADSALFTIDASTGALSFITAPDYANPLDSGNDNAYDVTVQASDGTLADTQDIVVTVTDVNAAPSIDSNSGGDSAYVSVAENTTAVTMVTATDSDGDTLAYSITGGVNSSLFTINAATGALSFFTAPDYENPLACGNSYDVIVAVSDGTLSDTQNIHVSVYNVNEAPIITSAGGGATAIVFSAENVAFATTTVAAIDPDGNSLVYSKVGGADSARFAVNSSTGVVSFLTAPDFESPSDQGQDNVYDLTVQVSDGTLTDTQAIAITITNVAEAPRITSNGGFGTGAAGVAENTTAVTTVTATDSDGDTVAYSISGGADSAIFTINATTGALSFLTAPDFENPLDSGGDNVYDVTVQASDGALTRSQALAVTVSNQNEAPVITSNGGGATAAVTINENTTAVATVAGTDVDGNSLTYSISGGADSARFTVNASTGALSFITAPDYEAPTDTGTNNVYNVVVQASDGTLADTQAIAVTVSNNTAEAPSVLGDMLFYSAASSASSVVVSKLAFFMNDSAASAKSTWSLANITNTPAGGTATLSSGNISVTGFDTATTDTFTYQATDVNGTSGTATVTVQRVASANITGTNGADIIIGSNTGAALSGLMGNDFILGGTGNDTLTGGMDADDLTGGAGADVHIFAEGADGVGPTAVDFAAGASTQIDFGDVLVFGNGVDIVRGFVSGSDKLDFVQSGSLFALGGLSSSSALNPNRNYSLLGDYNEVTRMFVVNSASGSDLLVVQGDSIAPDNFVASETDFIVLIGTTSIVGTDIV